MKALIAWLLLSSVAVAQVSEVVIQTDCGPKRIYGGTLPFGAIRDFGPYTVATRSTFFAPPNLGYTETHWTFKDGAVLVFNRLDLYTPEDLLGPPETRIANGTMEIGPGWYDRYGSCAFPAQTIVFPEPRKVYGFDANGDGSIDALDAGLLFEHWTGDSASTPEPSGAGLLLLAAACLRRFTGSN